MQIMTRVGQVILGMRTCSHLTPQASAWLQDERSQHKNKAKALKILRARMFEAERERHARAQSVDRKGQIGTGDRSERVRTYNFPQVQQHGFIGLPLFNDSHESGGDG